MSPTDAAQIIAYHNSYNVRLTDNIAVHIPLSPQNDTLTVLYKKDAEGSDSSVPMHPLHPNRHEWWDCLNEKIHPLHGWMLKFPLCECLNSPV